MVSWMATIHVLATFAFLITLGVSSVVTLRLRNRRDPAYARAWLELYADKGVYMALFGSLLLLLLKGIAGGFVGKWWGYGWIWLSLVLLIGGLFNLSFCRHDGVLQDGVTCHIRHGSIIHSGRAGWIEQISEEVTQPID